jgi:hypothetical protein
MAAKGSAEHKKAISKGIKRHHRLKKAAAKRGKVYKPRKKRADTGKSKGFKLGPNFKPAKLKKRKKRSDKGKSRGFKLGPNFKPAKLKKVRRKKRSDKGVKRGTKVTRKLVRSMSE